jgi:serine/threonine-protein phosphatase 5
MVCHGGLPVQDNVLLKDIRELDRFMEIPEKGIMCDILWADPTPGNGRSVSKRGVSMGFGPDISKQFLENNKLDILIRSHEVKNEGYE